MNEVKLYRKNAMGIGTWRIWFDGVLYYSHATVEGGGEVNHSDHIETNKSGRNIEQQIELEMNSRISKMLDKGYKYTREEAMAGSTNQLGLVNPMLAQPQKSLRPISRTGSAMCQPKFDGHRCLITNNNGDIIAYSRKGKLITTVPHILQDFAWLPEGRTVDGELYIHGEQLQDIGSLIKREQPGSRNLDYFWYDFVSDHVYSERYKRMIKAEAHYAMKHVRVAPTFKVTHLDQVYKLYTHFKMGLKYEGAMVRYDLAGYEDNKRAQQLVKVKVAEFAKRDECEVRVLGARPSKDGWAVLVVQTIAQDHPTESQPKPGLRFDISAPGSVPQKLEVMENIASYVGRKLTIEYAMLTNDGLPFHAVAMRWHDEV